MFMEVVVVIGQPTICGSKPTCPVCESVNTQIYAFSRFRPRVPDSKLDWSQVPRIAASHSPSLGRTDTIY